MSDAEPSLRKGPEPCPCCGSIATNVGFEEPRAGWFFCHRCSLRFAKHLTNEQACSLQWWMRVATEPIEREKLFADCVWTLRKAHREMVLSVTPVPGAGAIAMVLMVDGQ